MSSYRTPRALFLLMGVVLFFHVEINEAVVSESQDKLTSLGIAGEKLDYTITWQHFLNAAKATMTLSRIKDRYHISTDASSAKWLKIFGVKVHDVISAEFSTDMTKSFYFKAEIEEGSFRKTKIITFDHENKKIIYKDAKHPPLEYPLNPFTFDVLTAMYLLRTENFTVGETIKYIIFDDKQEYVVDILVLKEEMLKIGGKKINTFKTQVLLKTSGIFNRKGNLYIWFADDPKKIPVQVQSKIFLGSFFAKYVGKI
ncbi:MAG: DUF3108 domain-containing protein [Nitrospinota bacterium]